MVRGMTISGRDIYSKSRAKEVARKANIYYKGRRRKKRARIYKVKGGFAVGTTMR